MKPKLRRFTHLHLWFPFLGLLVIFGLYFLGFDLIAERCSYIFGERPISTNRISDQDVIWEVKGRSLVIVSFSFEGLVVFGGVEDVLGLRLQVQVRTEKAKKSSCEHQIWTLRSTKAGRKRRKGSPVKPVFFFQLDFTVEGLDLKWSDG